MRTSDFPSIAFVIVLRKEKAKRPLRGRPSEEQRQGEDAHARALPSGRRRAAPAASAAAGARRPQQPLPPSAAALEPALDYEIETNPLTKIGRIHHSFRKNHK